MRSLPILGNIANSVDSSYEAVKRVGMQKADEVIAANAGQMIGSIGATMLNSLHDHAMPVKVHKFVDNTYSALWPEMKKSLLDAVILDLGLEFRALKERMQEHDPPPPKGFLKRVAARLIYAMEPYDLTIWGTIRSPLSLLIQLVSLPSPKRVRAWARVYAQPHLWPVCSSGAASPLPLRHPPSSCHACVASGRG